MVKLKLTPLQIGALALWAAMLVFGLWAMMARLSRGHLDAAYGSYVVWGLQVSAYIYFIGLSAGAFLMSSLVYVFHIKALERVARLALVLALITLVMALVAIWTDIGHMERFYLIFTRPNFHSMMAWMIWFYTAYFLLMVCEAFLAFRPELVALAARGGFVGRLVGLVPKRFLSDGPDERAFNARWLTRLGALGIPLAFFFHGGVGALFGTLEARPYWNTTVYPILFLTGALLSGGALLAAVVAVFWPKGDPERPSIIGAIAGFVVALLLVDLMIEWAEYSIPLWYGTGPESDFLRYVLFGPYWWMFWVVHIGLGVVVPLALLSTPALRRNPRAVAVSGGLIASTFFAVRLNIVIPGLVNPNFQALSEAYVDTRLTFDYFPSAMEWGIFWFAVALGVALFLLADRLLPLWGTTLAPDKPAPLPQEPKEVGA